MLRTSSCLLQVLVTNDHWGKDVIISCLVIIMKSWVKKNYHYMYAEIVIHVVCISALYRDVCSLNWEGVISLTGRTMVVGTWAGLEWSRRAWNFPCYFHILWHYPATKCENDTENSKLWSLVPAYKTFTCVREVDFPSCLSLKASSRHYQWWNAIWEKTFTLRQIWLYMYIQTDWHRHVSILRELTGMCAICWRGQYVSQRQPCQNSRESRAPGP